MKILALFLAFFSAVAFADTRTVPADAFQINMSGNKVTLDAPSVSASYTYHMPSAQAAGTSCLVNDGSGFASWLVYASGNTATSLVERDGSGNFSAGTITATLNGSATSAGSVSGTVGVPNGGTGDTSFTNNALVVGNGTSPLAVIANNATGTTKFLSQVSSGVPVWAVAGAAIGSAVTGGTPGSALFVDGSGNLGQDNSNFFWDTTNARLGIGTTAPMAQLHVVGSTLPQVGAEGSGNYGSIRVGNHNNFGITSKYLEMTGGDATNSNLDLPMIRSVGFGQPLGIESASGLVWFGEYAPTVLYSAGSPSVSNAFQTLRVGHGVGPIPSGNPTLNGAGGLGVWAADINSDLLVIETNNSPHNRPLLSVTQSGNSRFMVNGTTGNVGIGTVTPAAKLQIVGGNVDIPATTSSAGQLTQAGAPILHTYGTNNLFAGTNAGNFTMTGGSNVALGYQALSSNTSGGDNIAIGQGNLSSNTTGGANVAIGLGAMQANTTGGGQVAVGSQALNQNTTGTNNTAMGNAALQTNTSGSLNTAVGEEAEVTNTTGSSNSGFGYKALLNNSTGGSSSAFGANSLRVNNADANSAFGVSSLEHNSSGQENTAIGTQAGYANTTGQFNTYLGGAAGRTNGITGSNNTYVGVLSDATADGFSNSTAIGYQALIGQSDAIILGDSTNANLKVGIGTNTPTAALDVNLGTIRYGTKYAFGSPPVACDAAHDGLTFLSTSYHTCVCNSSAYVLTADGTTACL